MARNILILRNLNYVFTASVLVNITTVFLSTKSISLTQRSSVVPIILKLRIIACKSNKNLRIPVLEDHEFSQSKDFLEKPRPYTFQMGSRLSLEIKNKNIHVLDCEKSIVQYALYYLTLLILK